MDQVLKSEEGRVIGENVEVESAVIPKKGRGSPLHSKSKWDQCRIAYERGDYRTVKELGERFAIKEFTLHSKINRESWKEKKQQIQAQAESTLHRQVVKELTKQESYLVRLGQRATKYEAIIDASLEQAGAKDAQGVNVLDLEAIDVVTRSESRLVEMQRTALRIPALSAMDHTTGGVDLGSSFVQALAKLRADPNAPMLQDADLARVLEADVEP